MAHQRDMFQHYMSSSGYQMPGADPSSSPQQGMTAASSATPPTGQPPSQQQQQRQQQQQPPHPNFMGMQQPNYPPIDPAFSIPLYHPQQYHPQQQQPNPQQQQQQQQPPNPQQQRMMQQQQQQQSSPIQQSPQQINFMTQQAMGYPSPHGFPPYSQPPPMQYPQQTMMSPTPGATPMNMRNPTTPTGHPAIMSPGNPHMNMMNASPNPNMMGQPPPPNMMYNMQPSMMAHPNMQAMRPMAPPPNAQFINTFSRSNGYPMTAEAQFAMQAAYRQRLQQQQQQMQQRQMYMQQFQRPMMMMQQPPAPPPPQQLQQQAPPPPRPKRPVRNAKKKKVSYDESSDEEDEMDFLEESEGSEDSEFEDSDSGRKSKRKGKNAQVHQGAPDEEPVVIPMGTKVFEKILDYRTNEDTGEEELLIKYKNTSYHHVDWVPLEQVEGEHLGKHRVKKFLQRWNQEGQKGEDFREYLKMDRIIDEGELTDPATGEAKIYYLVKWNAQFYDASTWENEDDVEEIDESKIEEFHDRRQISPQKLAPPPPRPDLSRFMKYDASPSYRYGNNLRSYQLEGLNWLRFCYYSYRSCILADEMGLGKTVQSVAFLVDLYHNLGVRGPFLVVAPLSTIPHWERAFKAWTDLNVVDFRGSTLARSLIVDTEFYYKDVQGNTIPNRYKFDVLITTYEMASASATLLREINWKCAVFDEAHRLKNKQSKVLEILKTFYIEHKLLLTGTPLQNNLDELYSLLNFMQPEVFYDERYFFAEYGNLQSAAQVERLQLLLKPIMLRRFKEDVEKTIPVKEETVIEVELTNPQKKWYRAILEKNFSFLKKAKTNKEMPHLRNIMMQLRKCCIHPYLLEGAEEVIVSECHARSPQEQFNCLVQSSGKLVLIDKLLKRLMQGNHKVLIFSQFTSCLDILADYLRGREYAHERIDGSVPGDQRQAAIDRFSTLPIEESFVFLLCTRAGGVGINLTAADTVIIFDSDWNPQNDLQAQARCHRIGQTKPVQIYRLICANTYEKDMFDRAGMKLGLDKAVMSRSGGSHDNEEGGGKHELSKKEIEDLLKKGAYGAMLDDEASTKFCEEDIDQILERRTTVIRHEGNEKGSVFSKATFSAAEDGLGVELDDPDFWEKWAKKANIDTTEAPDENKLILLQPRRRRQVHRFGSRPADGSYSSNDNADDSDAAYEEEPERVTRRRDQQHRLWSLSEKTKYERKLMIYGYGCWDQMSVYFPRRSEKDLKAVTRALMRRVLPQLHEEDRKLIDDIESILETDAADEVADETIPYAHATKKQIAEFRSFLHQATADYAEHIERKGRNFLLRIQMLHIIRDKIVPKDWEEAKELAIPKVTGNAPAEWWGEEEDRSLLLGICKHGYQQYLAMRNDPEFSFYGRKYDDSKAGPLEDEDSAPSHGKQDDDDYSDREASDTEDKVKSKSDEDEEDEQTYVWPSKAEIGMRLRRIIAAFQREHANDARKRKSQEKEQKKTERRTRQRTGKETRSQRQRAKAAAAAAAAAATAEEEDASETIKDVDMSNDAESAKETDGIKEETDGTKEVDASKEATPSNDVDTSSETATASEAVKGEEDESAKVDAEADNKEDVKEDESQSETANDGAIQASEEAVKMETDSPLQEPTQSQHNETAEEADEAEKGQESSTSDQKPSDR